MKKRAESPFLFFRIMASTLQGENVGTQSENTGEAQQIGLPGTPRENRVVIQVWELVEAVCKDDGMELVFVEYRREAAGRVLRLYVDRPGGITLDDCVAVSREISDLLDVHLEDVGPYRLEVSSPGVDRPLGRPSDFERFKGEEVRIKTTVPIDGQKNFKGVLEDLIDNRVRVDLGDRCMEIPLAEISKARLVNYNGEGRCL